MDIPRFANHVVNWKVRFILFIRESVPRFVDMSSTTLFCFPDTCQDSGPRMFRSTLWGGPVPVEQSGMSGKDLFTIIIWTTDCGERREDQRVRYDHLPLS